MKKMKIYIEKTGYKKVSLYQIEGTDELLLAEFNHKKENYYGILDINGRLLVDFSTWNITKCFKTLDNNNFGFTRYNFDDTDYESIHLARGEDDLFYVRANIKGNDVTKCRLVNTIKDEFWFIEADTNGIKEFSLYDIKEAKILTPGFADISFEEEKSRVLAFVEKALYGEYNEEVIYLGSLLSYIDWEGNFVAPFYLPEKDLLYSSITYNFDKSFKSFNITINSITRQLLKEYIEKNDHVTQILDNMFNDLYTKEEMKPNGKAKILNFKKKDVSNG